MIIEHKYGFIYMPIEDTRIFEGLEDVKIQK
jgi:hypothetical protein